MYGCNYYERYIVLGFILHRRAHKDVIVTNDFHDFMETEDEKKRNFYKYNDCNVPRKHVRYIFRNMYVQIHPDWRTDERVSIPSEHVNEFFLDSPLPTVCY